MIFWILNLHTIMCQNQEKSSVIHFFVSLHVPDTSASQGCIICGILVSGIRVRGVSSEHMENMEMFSCSPT